MTSSYFFIFGRTPDLSFAELVSVIPQATRIVSNVALVAEADFPVDSIESLMQRLGGTVKIAKVLGKLSSFIPDEVAPFITGETVVFGISCYGGLPQPTRLLLSQIKDRIETRGGHVRFVESRHGEELSSVVIKKSEMQELVVVKKPDGLAIGVTCAVQPFEEWNHRDYDRPYADPKSGMLPPKVARMLINIAIGEKNPCKITILDPFCGMGTIIAEALLGGSRVIGSDQLQSVIDKAKGNIDWLTSNYMDVAKDHVQFFVSDAVHVSAVIAPDSVDCIVTEPFMGSTDISYKPEKIRNIIKGLEKLYVGALKDWQKVLKENGTIVIALPSYIVEKRVFFVKKIIDMCEILGYTKVLGPIEYSRPQAVVHRQIFVFQKKG